MAALTRLSLLAAFLVSGAVAQNTTNSTIPDVLSYVDQLIGSSNGGNIFPGATIPYGMFTLLAYL